MKDQVIKGNNALALDLYIKLGLSGENIFFSPFSIFCSLALSYAGAREKTADQLKKTLRITLEQDKFHTTIGQILKKLTSKRSFILNIANALWINSSYRLVQDFLELIQTHYEGATYKLDFKETSGVSKRINSWVSEKTNGKISKIIDASSIKDDIGLLVTNAIYFLGKWDKIFKVSNTRNQPFTLISEKIVRIPMMHQTDKFGYLEEENVQILEMCYKSYIAGMEEMSMIIFLPKEKNGIYEFEKNLSLDKLLDYISNLRTQKVEIFIPRYKMEVTAPLVVPLSQLGMPIVFSEQADFSGIASPLENLPIYINKLLHKAFIEVNEEGTEAAAATMMTFIATGLAKRPPIFRADHPFLFLIQDLQTKAILFMGRVMNPPPAEAPKGSSSAPPSLRDGMFDNGRSKRENFFGEMKEAFEKRNKSGK